MNLPARFLPALFALFIFAFSAFAADPREIRGGSEIDFRPYCFTDKAGQPTGFGVELLQAVADKMGLRLRITAAPWDTVWNKLIAGQIDILPVVARTPGREPLVDFSLPHTETFDAFFIRDGRPSIKDLSAASGKDIVVLRSDAAEHQLLERKFPGHIIPVESIADGLRLIASGKYDAMLCSKLIGILEAKQAGIAGVTAGPPIPDYKRVFSFAVHKGNDELLEKLNQGLRIAKADGTYDQLYGKWLGVERPPALWWQTYFWRTIGILGVLVLIVITLGVTRKAITLDYQQAQSLTPAPGGVLAAFWRYALAVAAVMTGFAVCKGMEAWIDDTLPPFIMFYPAVILAALLGGIGPGLLAIVLSAVITTFWMLPPIGQFAIAAPVDRLGLALFGIVSLFISAVVELYRRNRTKAAAFDLTEALRQSEEKYRKLFENMAEEVHFWQLVRDETGNIKTWRLIDANPPTLRTWGRSGIEEIRGKTTDEIFGPGATEHYRAVVEKIMTEGVPHSFEDYFPHLDKYFRFTSVPFGEFFVTTGADITLIKKTELALRESEERLRTLYSSMNEGLAIHEVVYEDGRAIDYIVTEVNPAYEKITGLTRVSMVGHPASELYDTHEAPYLKIYAEVASTGKPTSFETYFPPMEKHFAISVSSPGKGKFATVFQDITERKQSEEALRVNEERMQQALQVSRSFTFEWNPVTDQVIRSASCAMIMKLIGDEAVNDTGQNYFQRVHPDDREPFVQMLRNLTPASNSYITTYRIKRGDGSVAVLEEIGQATFDAADTLVRLVGVTTDITERKQIEEALRQSREDLDRAQAVGQIGCWRLDTRNNMLTWSAENHRIFGVPEGTPKTYEFFLSTIYPEDRTYVDTQWQAALHGEPYDIEHRIVAEGRLKWVREKAYLEFGSDGNLLGGFGITQDITERKQAEDELIKRTTDLEAANRELESFSYSVSHDLRAPLRAIDGYTHMILKKHGHEFDEDTMRKFNNIRSNARMMGQLIDDLLAFSRLGKKTLSMSTLDMNAIILDIWNELQTTHQRRKMELAIKDIPPGYGDRALIRQVYANLLSNAVKFTKHKNIARIETGGYAEGNEHVYYVRDNGVGFDMTYHDKLFGVFERLHDPDDYEGTGVGLATVQRIVHRHAGRIWADSKEGEGTTFYFSLPNNRLFQGTYTPTKNH
jgi:PAS domain S-box-containing protein